MDVSSGLWFVTIAGLAAVILLDLFLVDSKPGVFGPKQATRWVIFYVTLAVLFGLFIYVQFGAQYGGEFFAGYITEYSLSVDNLFVFIIIMSSFAVPQEYQHRVLLVGVVIALILRAILITVGAAAIERFAFTFYIFGGLLLITAIGLLRGGDDDSTAGDNALVRTVERLFRSTPEYHGSKLVVRIDGRRHVTPMLLVMVAIGTTDILFALDSIPAIFGLTEEAYLVFTANAFALMGLRQLYFLVSGLLEKLVYLSTGLAIILAFIGVKLILHAIHETTDLPVPEISIALSLTVIIGVLLITAIASLVAVRRNPALIQGAETHAHTRQIQHPVAHDDDPAGGPASEGSVDRPDV